MKHKLIYLWVVLLLLAACGNQGKSQKKPEHELTPSPLVSSTATVPETLPATLDPLLRSTLEPQYELLRQSQQQIESIWTDLRAGRSVACTSVIEAPASPEAFAGQDALSRTLYRAAIEIDRALALWQAECQHPRQQPPADVIDRGLLAARAAGDALRTAADLLSH